MLEPMNARHRFLQPIAICIALGAPIGAVAATGASAKSFRTLYGNSGGFLLGPKRYELF